MKDFDSEMTWVSFAVDLTESTMAFSTGFEAAGSLGSETVSRSDSKLVLREVFALEAAMVKSREFLSVALKDNQVGNMKVSRMALYSAASMVEM